MSRDRSSPARAAVSWSIRHSTRSRRSFRSSVNSLSSRARGTERSPRQAGLRRSSRRPGFVARISCRPAQAVKDVNAHRCRFQVAAAAPSHRSITAA